MVQTLSRYGPLLPELVDRSLSRAIREQEPVVVVERRRPWLWALGGAIGAGLVVALFEIVG